VRRLTQGASLEGGIGRVAPTGVRRAAPPV